MKLNQLRDLLEKQKDGEISIHEIVSGTGSNLISNIVPSGKLEYDTFKYTLTYTSPSFEVFQIVDISDIYQVNYTDLAGKNQYDKSIDEDFPDYPSTIKHTYPDNDIINTDIRTVGKLEDDGYISPYVLKDNRLVYPTGFGNLFTSSYMDNNPGDICDSEIGQSFIQKYYKLNNGILQMKLNLPEAGMYKINVRTASRTMGGKFYSIYINNSERFVKVGSDQPGIWQNPGVQRYNSMDDTYVTVDKFIFDGNKTTIDLRYNLDNGTLENYIDALILEQVFVRPSYKNIKNQAGTSLTFDDLLIYPSSQATLQSYENENLTGGVHTEVFLTDEYGNKVETIPNYSQLDYISTNPVNIGNGRLKYIINSDSEKDVYLNILGWNTTKNHNIFGIVLFNGKFLEFRSDFNNYNYDNFKLINRNTISSVVENNPVLHLVKGVNEIVIVAPVFGSGFWVDAITISENIYDDKTNDGNSSVYPNINDIYFFDNSVEEANRLIKRDLSHDFNLINSYNNKIDQSQLIYTVLGDGLGTLDSVTQKINYQVLFNVVKNGNQGVTSSLDDYYLPKILLLADSFNLDQTIKIRPYIYRYKNTINTSTDIGTGDDITTLVASDREIVPLFEFNEEPVTYDLGSDWKNYIVKNMHGLSVSQKVKIGRKINMI
jgi:hypothetical protein